MSDDPLDDFPISDEVRDILKSIRNEIEGAYKDSLKIMTRRAEKAEGTLAEFRTLAHDLHERKGAAYKPCGCEACEALEMLAEAERRILDPEYKPK